MKARVCVPLSDPPCDKTYPASPKSYLETQTKIFTVFPFYLVRNHFSKTAFESPFTTDTRNFP
jgi:hypothetical protein